jgi:hypothetical protein
MASLMRLRSIPLCSSKSNRLAGHPPPPWGWAHCFRHISASRQSWTLPFGTQAVYVLKSIWVHSHVPQCLCSMRFLRFMLHTLPFGTQAVYVLKSTWVHSHVPQCLCSMRFLRFMLHSPPCSERERASTHTQHDVQLADPHDHAKYYHAQHQYACCAYACSSCAAEEDLL